MSNNTEALIARAKHIVENGGLLSRDTSLQLIAALEQAQAEREEFRKRLKLEREILADADSDLAELRQRIAELETRQLSVKLPQKIERNDIDGWFMYNGRRVGGGAAEWYNKALEDVECVLTAAGGTVEGEVTEVQKEGAVKK